MALMKPSLIMARQNERSKTAQDLSLGASLLASSLLHVVALIAVSIAISNRSTVFKTDFVPVSLLDVPPIEEKNTLQPKVEAKPAPAPKVSRDSEPKLLPQRDLTKDRPASAAKEESAKPATLPPPAANTIISTVTRIEGGGSEAGSGNLFSKGDAAVVPGSGTSGGGGGTAAAGLGRGSGAPGLPAQTAILKTNREAKPIQTVRAAYPPLALRMGMEGDVIIRIELDAEGKVTKADIIKSGGIGFDEEALKAVKQSRFEPAQKDGQNVPAEFTYIYRFRLAR